MPSETTQLRIYCVCGQKMKVSEDMFGRPGKCVACRQKIRIPKPEEMPPNTTELYLKDHPEFLRKVKHRPIDEQEVAPIPEQEEGKRRRSSTPIDVLEPLRVLCNLRDKVERQLEAFSASKEGASGKLQETNKAELLGYRARIKNAQADLEEDLRQRLMETAIELANVQEKIAGLCLAVRVGESTFAGYLEQVDKLRRKRDHFERRQVNLRGWLTVDDPHLAGGHMEVTFDQIPRGEPRVSLPSESDGQGSLLDWHVEELRQALEVRSAAERKLGEAERMKTGAAMSERSLEEIRLEAQGERTRARARVQFCRERLEQLAEDYASDMQAIDAQLDHARGRLKAGRTTREQFNQAEQNCNRSRADLMKARAVVVRALSANTVEEVPRLRGTFIERLARPSTGARATADVWVAAASACLLFAVLGLPVAGTFSPLKALSTLQSQGGDAHWLVSFPSVVAILAVLSAFIPFRATRGLLFTAVWLIGSLLSVAYLHEAAYAIGIVETQLREGGPLLTRAGIIVFTAGLSLLGLAAAMALLPLRETRAVFPIAALVLAAGIAAVVTDFGGYRLPKPDVQTSSVPIEGVSPLMYETKLTVQNNGGRMLILAPDMTMHNAYDFILESRIGTESWAEVREPVSVQVSGRPEPQQATGANIVPVASGSNATYTYRLKPGTYRVLLQAHDPVRSRQFAPFTLAAAAPGSAAQPGLPAAPGGQPADPGSAQQLSNELLRQITAQVELRAIIAAQGKPANFSIAVTLPDGRSRTGTYTVGAEVHDGWSVREFNPNEQTVTLSKDKDVLIIRRGAPYVLAPPNGYQ